MDTDRRPQDGEPRSRGDRTAPVRTAPVRTGDPAWAGPGADAGLAEAVVADDASADGIAEDDAPLSLELGPIGSAFGLSGVADPVPVVRSELAAAAQLPTGRVEAGGQDEDAGDGGEAGSGGALAPLDGAGGGGGRRRPAGQVLVAGKAVGGAVGTASRRTAARTAALGTTAVSTLTGPQARALTAQGARRTARGAWWTARGAGWVVRHVLPLEQPLLREEAFRFFWLSRVAVQTAQGALLYALLIVVADRTDASFYNALFVACSIVPAILFGLPGGIVVDALPRRPLMVGLNLVRFFFVVSLMVAEPSLGGIFAATLGIWVIHQFYSPSESAVVAALVPRERYAAAQALSNLALTLAQSVGLILLAPVLLKTAGPRTLYAVCATLFFVAAGMCALLPRLDGHLRPAAGGATGSASSSEGRRGRRPARSFGSTRKALLAGWRTVRSDQLAYEALTTDVLVGIGMSSLVVIMPVYLERVLGTAKENTVFVFAPAALGLVVGLRVAPRLGAAIGARRAATLALGCFAATIAAFGFVEGLHGVIERARFPINAVGDAVGLSPLVMIAMALSIPAGLASAVVGVTTRSVLLSRIPPAARGQVIATQNLMGNLAALVPTLLTGIAADLIGVEPIAVVIAMVIVGGALYARTVARRPAPFAHGSVS